MQIPEGRELQAPPVAFRVPVKNKQQQQQQTQTKQQNFFVTGKAQDHQPYQSEDRVQKAVGL